MVVSALFLVICNTRAIGVNRSLYQHIFIRFACVRVFSIHRNALNVIGYEFHLKEEIVANTKNIFDSNITYQYMQRLLNNIKLLNCFNEEQNVYKNAININITELLECVLHCINFLSDRRFD